MGTTNTMPEVFYRKLLLDELLYSEYNVNMKYKLTISEFDCKGNVTVSA